jgi:hypothetical protein
MFQSLTLTKYFGYNEKAKLHLYEYEIMDSDFSCIAVAPAGAAGGVVIQEYSKRNLNVAANLIKFFLYHQKKYGYSIAKQIEWAERYQPLFTPELKADLNKYLLLL